MRRTVQHFAARVADEVIDRGERFHGDPDPWDGLAMRWMVFAVALLLIGSATACTKENSAFCCTTAEDCARFGASDLRDCDQGLVCVNNACQSQSCESQGCTAAAPNCDVTTDVCVGCADPSECSRFPSTSVCDTTSGSCVACLVDADCGAAMPVCDANACRTCRADSECSSGACGDDGACVQESSAVYLAATGTDTAPCSKTKPCRDPLFATLQTSNSRPHIVFTPGTYDYGSNEVWSIDGSTTSAAKLTVHGSGATIKAASDDGFVTIAIPTTMRDLTIVNTAFFALRVLTIATVENVKLRGGTAGLLTNGSLTLRHSEVVSNGCGIELDGGLLTIDGATVTGGVNGVCNTAMTILDVANLLVYGTSGVGMDLGPAKGMVSFTTVAGTGTVGTGATAVRCALSSLVFTSSIAWTLNSIRPVVENCSVSSSIVGSMGIVGGVNVNPSFVNPSMNNFHINAGSPAVDMSNTGPARDFEGEARPKGARFDWGADEAQ